MKNIGNSRDQDQELTEVVKMQTSYVITDSWSNFLSRDIKKPENINTSKQLLNV